MNEDNNLLHESNVGKKTMQYTAWEHKIHISPNCQVRMVELSRAEFIGLIGVY